MYLMNENFFGIVGEISVSKKLNIKKKKICYLKRVF